MKNQKLFTLLILFSCYSCFFLTTCKKDNSDKAEEGQSVTVNVTLLSDASGKILEVILERQIDFNNGFDYVKRSTCGNGTSLSKTFTDIPEGTYYLFVVVYVASDGTLGPQPGDYSGTYGLTAGQNPDDLPGPNVNIPESGTVSFNVTLYVMEG